MNSREVARCARINCLKMVHAAQASHIASALSIIDIVSILYDSVMNVFPSDPKNPERDRFILSKGHACVGVYTVLAEKGFFDRNLLETYGKDNSMLMQHISHKVPGVEFSTGSLGHGLPFGVGKALAAVRKGQSWRTYVLMSDGEMQEGSNWEALMFAAHHKLSKLSIIIDNNNLQSLTTVDETLNIQPLGDKLRSFGWSVKNVNGHDHSALKKCFETTSLKENKPTAIIARTTKGKGVSFFENKVEWHYRSPSTEELKTAIIEIENA